MTTNKRIPLLFGAGALRPHRCLCLAVVVTAVACAAPAQQTQDAPAPAKSLASTFTIPDGTSVPLRFAQPLRGKVPCLWKSPCPITNMRQSNAGDTVRMVAASDVRVGQYVVIAKGALGQATVTKVWRPFMALTGLALRFDWVQDVTGKQVPLRLQKKGKQEPFTIQVLSSTGGMVARKETLRGDLAGKDAVDASLIWRKKNWIPAGTRIQSYTHGDTGRDTAEVSDAQALLPISNDVATLTVYRTKGEPDTHLHLRCDGNDVGMIESQQFLVTELTPGKHTCQAEHEATLAITANAGEDYFVRVLASTPGAWQLKLMDAGEGEDTIATLAPAGKPAAANDPQ